MKDPAWNGWAGDWIAEIKKNLDAKKFRVLKRKVSDTEVVAAGLAAGSVSM